jgi:hypothetical protein
MFAASGGREPALTSLAHFMLQRNKGAALNML